MSGERAETAYRVEPATPEDVGWIARLEAEVYSPSDAVPERVLRDWYGANPDGFSVVKKHGLKVGHLDLLPLRPEPLRRFLDGIISERDIRGGELYPPAERGEIRDLYVESLAFSSLPGHSSAPLVSFLLSNFNALVQRLCDPAQVGNLYAVAASGAGESLMRRLGFERVKGAEGRADKHALLGAALADLTSAISTVLRGRRRARPTAV